MTDEKIWHCFSIVYYAYIIFVCLYCLNYTILKLKLMITVVHAIIMLSLIVLPLLKVAKKNDKTVGENNNNDTVDAHYVVNERGFLEEISGNKLSDQHID